MAWLKTYNANGWVSEHWTPVNGLTEYTYDEVGNLKAIDYESTTNDIAFDYDAVNRLTSMTDLAGTTTFGWTAWGALASEDGPWAQDTVSWDHNAAGQRSKLTVGAPNATPWEQTYAYDDAWRWTGITSPAGAFGYDYGAATATSPANLLRKLTLPSGSFVTNAFDDLGRLLSTILKNSTNSVLDYHGYGYNVAHQRTSVTNAWNNRWDYTYDGLGELTSAIGRESGGTLRAQKQLGYGYDAAGNLSQRRNNTFIQTFSIINALNQLTSVSRSGNFTVTGLATPPVTSVTVKDNANPAQAATLYSDNSFARSGISLNDGNNTFTAVGTDALSRAATNAVTVSLPSSVSYQSGIQATARARYPSFFPTCFMERWTCSVLAKAWSQETI